MSIAKIVVVAALFTIIFVLFRGLYYLVKGEGNPEKTVKFLSWRIGLSILLMILLLIAVATGLIEPHGLDR